MSLPIVFLHGWGLHGGVWDGVAAALPGRATRAPNLPGYGGRPSVSPYTAEALADRLAAVLPEPAVVAGWSLGGMVALAWAARRPDQVKGLVLVGVNPVFVNRADWRHGLAPEVLDGFADGLAADYRATLLRFLALQARGGEAARQVIALLRGRVFEQGEPAPETLAAGLELLHGVDLRGLLPSARCPTLVVHGGHDTLCPPTAGEWLAANLPAARLAMHPHASHAPFLSHPAWFNDRLREFLDDTGL